MSVAPQRNGATDARLRPRILVVSESLPYPTLKGGELRTWQNVNALASFARVGVFGLCSNDQRRHAPPDAPLACWSASTDPALTAPPPKGVTLPARAWLLDPQGHPSDIHFSAAAAAELAQLLATFRPQVVLVEGLWLQRYLDVARAAGCRTILDCHNVEAAVLRELAPTTERQGLEARVLRDVLPRRTEAMERQAIASVDQVWVCSPEDERRMRALYDPTTPIAVVPNGLRLADYDGGAARASPAAAAPLTLLFPGILSYRPNALAAMFLVEQVLPRLIEAHPACRLLVVGAQPAPELRAAAARDARVVVTGPVRDMRPYLAAATAMAVPLFHGGGTHLKVLEGFAAGLPVISTPKGAEGLAAKHGTHLLIAESAAQFVDAALAVWRDRALTDHLTTHARALVAEHYAWDAIGPRIRQAIDALAI